MDTPGITVDRVTTMGGERTNITFYEGVEVPDSMRVGDVDDGWAVIGYVLAMERGVFPVVPGRCARLLELAVEWAQEAVDDDGRRVVDDEAVRERFAWTAITNEVGRLLALRTGAVNARGEVPVVEGSMTKLFTTEAMQDVVRDLLDVVGAPGLVAHGQPGAVQAGAFEKAIRHAPLETITGGTSEIQRGIIASAGLGLPRSR
jgi:alkylation response protein AidB-like acyl-CoA dehydrogenase